MKLFQVLVVTTMVTLVCFHSTNSHAQTIIANASLDEGLSPSPFLDNSSCVSAILHERQMKQASFKTRQDEIERMLYEKTADLLEQRRNKSESQNNESTATLTVPLIIHIVHLSTEPNPGDGSSNPTDAQILAGIDHLNQAYQNIGVYAADGHNPHPAVQSVGTDIEFCLAQRDINGNPTTGILRYASDTYTNLNIDQEDPQMQQWVADQNGGIYPGTEYAHVWLVNEICRDSGSPNIPDPCGIAGYAYFPAGHGSVNNGVINLAAYWGTNTNASKIHIHEFGHYLNLYHTFQDGCVNNDCLSDGDRVCDTPPDDILGFSNCGSASNSCNTDADDLSANNPFQEDVDDLYENYMDYTATTCQNTFTQGQKDRMRSALLGTRGSLLNSQACVPVNGAEAGLTAILFPDQNICTSTFTPVIEVQSNGNQVINSISFDITLDGVTQSSFIWNGTLAPDEKTQISLNQLTHSGEGSHLLGIEIININASPDPFPNNNFRAQSFQYADPIVALPFCEDVETGTITTDWVISNPDNGPGFEPYNISTCANAESYLLGLQTWGTFPGKTTTEEIVTQSIDLSSSATATLDFDLAYAATYNNFNTLLDVSVSTDCGLSYTSLYQETGSTLATAVRTANSSTDPEAFFVPTDCNEWRTESLSLTQFAGQEIIIRFQASTADIAGSAFGYFWGNNLYLDNFCISSTPCTTFNSISPSPQAVCEQINLSAQTNTLQTEEVLGWWITKDVPITSIATNASSTAAALATATTGGPLESDANVIYEANIGNPAGDYLLNLDCEALTSKTSYFATPFISKKADAVPEQQCTVNSNGNFGISFNSSPGKFTVIDPAAICRPTNALTPSYSLTVTISNYSGNEDHILLFRDDNYNGSTLLFRTISGDGTYVFDETDFPGYDPGNPGGSVGMTIISWEEGGNGMENGQISASLEITYPGLPEVPFPTINYTDCIFGSPIEFSCSCTGNNICAEEELVIDDDPIIPGIYANASAIFSTGSIIADDTVRFKASESITLLPGFHANNESFFHATIADCETSKAFVGSEPIAAPPAESRDHLPTPSLKELDVKIAPNPFSSETSISYYLPEKSMKTTLILMNANGQKVQSIVLPSSGEGWHQFQFSADHLAAGIYILSLRTSGQSINKKLLVF